MLQDFPSLLRAITEKPETYVGSPALRDVEIFLDGMRFTILAFVPEEDPFSLWQQWVELRFNIRHPQWRWTRILKHEFGSDEKVLRVLADLYDVYLRETKDTSEDDMADQVLARFRQKYGSEYRVPPEALVETDGAERNGTGPLPRPGEFVDNDLRILDEDPQAE